MAARSSVVLVRHGEVHNPEGILYGRLPGYHLSDRGRDQALVVAGQLSAGRPVVAVVSSPLERARETAAPIAAALGLEVAVDERLIESANVFEGRVVSERAELFRPGNWRHLVDPLRPSWGEPYREIAERMQDAVAAAREAHPTGRVVCVSHQSPIWVARRAYEAKPLGHDPRRRECAHASLTTLTFEADRVVGIGYETPAGHL